jgi:hypothetical protein
MSKLEDEIAHGVRNPSFSALLYYLEYLSSTISDAGQRNATIFLAFFVR